MGEGFSGLWHLSAHIHTFLLKGVMSYIFIILFFSLVIAVFFFVFFSVVPLMDSYHKESNFPLSFKMKERDEL